MHEFFLAGHSPYRTIYRNPSSQGTSDQKALKSAEIANKVAWSKKVLTLVRSSTVVLPYYCTSVIRLFLFSELLYATNRSLPECAEE